MEKIEKMFWKSDDLERLGKKTMKEFGDLKHLDDKQCRIAYQWCDKEKKSNGKLVMADTTIVNDKMKAVTPYDFLITFYQPNCFGLDEERMKRLMYHELCHVGFEAPDNYSIVPHDLEDFRRVVDKWGTNWIRNN